MGEMTNMGLSHDTLVILSLHFLLAVYCLVVALLLESGAIQSLPSDVPNCYGNSGLTHTLKLDKLSLIVPSVEQQVSSDPEFFAVDRRRAGAVAASILAARTASQPPATSRSDLRERLSSRTRRPVGGQRITFSPPRLREDRAFPSRIFTNSRAKFRDLARDRTGTNPVRGLAAQNSNETVAPATQDDTNREVVSDRVEVTMEEDEPNPNLGVEEALPTSFFHASRSFPGDVNETYPDQQILAGDSMKKNVPGSNTQPGYAAD